jgi:hypothetical protein
MLKQSPRMVALVSLLLLAVSAPPALGKDNKHGKSHKGEARKEARSETATAKHGHRRAVRQHVTREGLPPGLAKRESLPPGLRRQLRERGRLPPGLQKRLEPVPPAYAGRWPPIPPHYHRYFAGRDVVVIDTRTNRVVTVLRDARP